MRTVTRPASLSKPTAEPCWQCNSPTPSDFNIDPVLCPHCRQAAQEQAIQEARGTVQALRTGLAPFAALPAGVRMRHLVTLFGNGGADKGRCHFGSDMTNEDLITLAGEAADEIARRMGSVQPIVSQPVREFSFTADTEISLEDRDSMEATIEAERFDGLC